MKKITSLILELEKKMCEILLILLIVLVFIAAALRWFRLPLVWSVDMAQLFFVWVSFIGADIALQNNRHIGVDIFIRNLPVKVKNVLTFITYISAIAFLGFVLYYGVYLAIINYRRQFSGMEFSFSWATAAAPLGALLMIRTLIKKIYFLITNKPDEEVEQREGLITSSTEF